MEKSTTKKKTLGYWLKSTLKGRLSRMAINIEKRRKKLLSLSKKPSVSNMQARAMDLFMVLLKSKESNLNHSPESKVRFIETDLLWLTMSYANDRSYLINIIDQSDKDAHSHEVYIPIEYAYEMMDAFDLELEKRFRSIEAAKKKVVVDDIEKLIKRVQPEQTTSNLTVITQFQNP